MNKLVIDIGTQQFEGNNLVLSYNAFSRATQLGNPDDILTNALFFDSPNVCPERLMKIKQRVDNKGL
jgi:hypothetical protein